MLKALLASLVLLTMIFCSHLSPSQAQEIKIGVSANRGAAQAFKEWKPTADYLSTKLGRPFAIVPLGEDQVFQATKEGKIDFICTNPATYVEINKLYGTQAVASLVVQFKGQPIDRLGSAIIVKRDSPINTLSDFKGKVFMCKGRLAFGGWLMALRLFLENGIHPVKEFKEIRDTKTHDNVVYAVLNGAVDGGAVRTGTLEKMVQEGKIKMEDFKLIHQVMDGFPQVHSTQLYPEYPMAACSHIPAPLRNDVAQALMALAPSDPAAEAAKIMKWTKPLDYTPVVECLTTVQHGAFAKQTVTP